MPILRASPKKMLQTLVVVCLPTGAGSKWRGPVAREVSQLLRVVVPEARPCPARHTNVLMKGRVSTLNRELW